MSTLDRAISDGSPVTGIVKKIVEETKGVTDTKKMEYNVTYGPIFWTVIHRIALANCYQIIPDVLLTAMDNVMDQFPCKTCRQAYRDYLLTRQICL